MRSSSSTKGKGVFYDSRLDNLLLSIEYSNEDENNSNNTDN